MEWQPIETAPDHERVLIFIPQWADQIQTGLCVEGRWMDAARFCLLILDEDKPTHWMPLPPPPKITT